MRIHLLGIGGTGMCSLAGLLAEAGHDVTGTDSQVYPPMSDQLKSLGIAPFEGYKPSNIDDARPDLVVVGNVIRRDNPEAQEVLRRSIPYRSMPAVLSELFLADRTPFVVAGTHGKTTSATIAAWLLECLGEEPGFLIGGVGINLGRSYALGRGPFFVVEGDEYDTAFFDKGPKFLHYRPRVLILTSIEFDHADIYRDIDHLMDSFRQMIAILPPDGLIAANCDDENVRSLTSSAPCRVVTYGLGQGARYRPHDISCSEGGTSFALTNCDARFLLPMWGGHNLSNAAGVIAAMLESGGQKDAIADGLAKFKGIRRRQEVAGEIKGVTVVDDFAHHPTAVAKTIESMRLRFPGRRLWAIFEPRSNTSRRKVFQGEFAMALKAADRVIVASPYREEDIPKEERFDSDEVAASIMRSGTHAHHIDTAEHMVEFVMRGVDAGDVILIMSNGTFDGLHSKILGALEKRRIYTSRNEIPRGRVPR